ncbi:tributyrin esterase [Enterococcus moraviensis ATCC BAA-383]|uniref:Tributyrin esterase n=1 Tax=Enterococcus moraviensis ATCC BAA-383 TaxID=1158609 RepID=R2TMF4_9ENTE|nr:alpha/beta hydrolase family protein [Enterococcus moraviensis]EOI06369.1 tributyrin esterase [Enterococcus moraviensis ATCC BAA-383]EOT63729.1 tributyrin esterase [Enterococcus moraviensis ATCC BAA-383]OJG67141.1 tributyrin esterase [Enterococcus moraviensis]
MAFLQANIYSNILEMEVSLNVILPQKTEKKIGTASKGNSNDVPVMYLLHGMGGNHSVWERRTSIERYVSDLGIAVIMPSTDLGWYTDTRYDMNYWTFIAEELPMICHELFPQLTTRREKTFAVGLSMGGYGALKLGLSKPEKFGAVASLSGAVNLADRMEDLLSVKSKNYWEGIFGPLEQVQGSINDPMFLLDQLVKSGKNAPNIFLCCGEADPLLYGNKKMAAALQENYVEHTFETGPGQHDWVFWDEWIQRVLAWLPLNR